MRSRLVIGVIVGVAIGVLLSTAIVALAGDPAGPDTPPGETEAYTLADIYHSLDSGAAAAASAFTEPAAGPGTGTMVTLDDIYTLTRQRAPVPRTGQISPQATGDDGDLQRGVAWPSPRFTDNGDGTATDNLTGLIWLKNANCFGSRTWANALTAAGTLNNGECGLSDGSAEGDWRLPNVRELHSLTDFEQFNPALPSGHPFTGVQSYLYWSGTAYTEGTSYAWRVDHYNGYVSLDYKTSSYYVWPVRGGQ